MIYSVELIMQAYVKIKAVKGRYISSRQDTGVYLLQAPRRNKRKKR